MFELFSDRARRVLDLAQQEARMLSHDYIGTEHLLLGLIHEGEDVAAMALESLGISLEAARRQAAEIAGRGQQEPPGHMPFTSGAMKVLELARRESLALGHGFTGTEHILLGLVLEGDGVAARVLVRLGADPDRVRQQVIQLVLGDALARVAALDRRLAAVERWVGMRPDLGGLDQEIAQARREKQGAIDGQDFEAAVAWRAQESQLLAARATQERGWVEPAAGGISLVSELGRVNAELERLRELLREQGIDPQNGAA